MLFYPEEHPLDLEALHVDGQCTFSTQLNINSENRKIRCIGSLFTTVIVKMD